MWDGETSFVDTASDFGKALFTGTPAFRGMERRLLLKRLAISGKLCSFTGTLAYRGVERRLLSAQHAVLLTKDVSPSHETLGYN